MKRSYRLGLQRSDMCRFLKNKTGKVIGSLFLGDLIFSGCLFFHLCCSGEFSFYDRQKAAEYENLISQGLTQGGSPFVDGSFCSLGFSETVYPQVIILFLIKFVVFFLILFQYRTFFFKWMGRFRSKLLKMKKQSGSPFLNNKERGKVFSKKIEALKNKIQAQKRLSQKYDTYQKKKLEKISDLSRILIHSFKAGHFLSNCETLKLLKEIRETSFFLQENNFPTPDIETISVSDLIQNIQKMLQWNLIKNDISLDIHYDPSQEISLTTDPFLLEILLLGFLKSILFYLYKGSKISLYLENKKGHVQLKIRLKGHLIHDWYPLSNTSIDYGGFTLTGKKVLSLLQVLKASVSSPSQHDFLVTISQLSNRNIFLHDNVVMLKV